MKTSELYYDLPDGFVATMPVSPRSSAKMFIIDEQCFRHRTVADFSEELQEDALLVVNETAVLPARVRGHKITSGGNIEGLFLEEDQEGNWLMMLKANGKLRDGTLLEIGKNITLELLDRDEAIWKCRCSDARPPNVILQEIGTTPLPPYIRAARGDLVIEDEQDRRLYQTVYADSNQCHSVAAPTAGLHFDDLLLEKIKAKGIEQVAVTLHVGAGTFRPVETDTIETHPMHSEYWSVESEVLQKIAEAKQAHRPIIAVGTTTVRTLESLPAMDLWPSVGQLSSETQLLISPPYDFTIIDGLLTNFHLPNSTLLALVGALVGMDRLKSAYAEAILNEYRFFSYGDAMFIPKKM
ncbi:MAG: tRNA preQ1(34) S-adenosylmethionine ribosyltransferase-isomerase QueA [Planctomycetes bacterium]|nr:tRNA preQ1(34) S-adenosylmethionine ribosyltransferase-isomerase QueA [Planctomycetota bacterium]